MPAYGTYTGGLDATHPVLRALFGDRALAVLTGARAIAVPLPAARRRSRRRASNRAAARSAGPATGLVPGFPTFTSMIIYI